MSDNPPPLGYANEQVVFDQTTRKLRKRRDDERTVAGSGTEHHRFIVAAPIGVRDKQPLPPELPMLTSVRTCGR